MGQLRAWLMEWDVGLRGGVPLMVAVLLLFLPGCGTDRWSCDDPTCEPEPEDVPPGVQACDLHTFDEAPEGICIPHVDAGWHTALVRMVPRDAPPPHCPPSAAWVGLWGEEIVRYGAEPRRVIGCSVLPLATCDSLNWACVPYERDYPPCVLKDAQRECPAAYPRSTQVEPDGSAEPTLVCCADPPAAG